MKTFLTSAFLATALFAAPAMADCLSDIAKAEQALTTMQVDKTKADSAKALIDKGKSAMQNGDSALCETSSKELVTLLGIQ